MAETEGVLMTVDLFPRISRNYPHMNLPLDSIIMSCFFGKTPFFISLLHTVRCYTLLYEVDRLSAHKKHACATRGVESDESNQSLLRNSNAVTVVQ